MAEHVWVVCEGPFCHLRCYQSVGLATRVLLSDSTGTTESTADHLTGSNTNGTYDPTSDLKDGCKIS